ncbi:MAG: haloalkane dehalogenase [Deltaproteobacteria bacterium]|nr:haloalkane dehalogenase [Deltaproteobacteria bacterium]
MKALRTPDERFENLPDYPFKPHYVEVPDGEGGTLRIHYVDEGPADAVETLLLMHGEPSWSFLYRKMIPLFLEAGHRAVAPDLVGFGKSDKPANRNDYTYNRHVAWMHAWLESVGLGDITLLCQDWGSLIGLRLVGEKPELFSRVVVGNGGLPAGGGQASEAFLNWQKFSQTVPVFETGNIMSNALVNPTPEILAAYDAPFPDQSYVEGARIFPSLVPTSDDDPALPANQKAWEVLSRFEKPFLTAFSDGDPVTAGGEKNLQRMIPGAKGQPHTIIKGAGHFLQEDKGEELARVILDFIKQTPAKES